MHESNDNKRNALLHVCLEYLERYYVLIAFTAFIMDPDFNPLNPKQPTFGQFMKSRSEFRRSLSPDCPSSSICQASPGISFISGSN